MDYPVNGETVGRNDTLLNLLSSNSLVVQDYQRVHRQAPSIYLRQSFMAANKAFQAIDAPTQGIVVPYQAEGREIISELCAAFETNTEKHFSLLRRAQPFTVNVFPHEFKALADVSAVAEISPGAGVFFLDERYYSSDFGLCTEVVSQQEALLV